MTITTIKGPNLATIRARLKDHPKFVAQLPVLQKCITTRWVPYQAHGYFDIEVPGCQLCELVNDRCSDCVIGQVVGESNCDGTPYTDWVNSTQEREAAKRETKFLQRIETVLLEMKGKQS